MCEILLPFESAAAFSATLEECPYLAESARDVLAQVRVGGLVEPVSAMIRRAGELQISDSNLRESISAGGMNARKRALLLLLDAAARACGFHGRRDAVVHFPEAATRIAQILADQYSTMPRGSPIGMPSHLGSLALPDASADAVVLIDALAATQDMEAAWAELRRAVRPGGIVVATVAFDPTRPETAPFMAPGGRCGWGVIAGLRARGFARAAMVAVASAQHGIASTGQSGVMLLLARRDGGPVDAPLLHPVVWAGHLPTKLCLLLALPRSGTTLTTALFDVHSRFDAVYEPWNAKLLAGPQDARIETLLERAKLGREPGRFLFVKETAAQPSYVQNMRLLWETTSLPLDRRVLMLCRKPAHTFLSEVERRKEWWGADVAVNQEQFDLWCSKTRGALRAMLDLVQRADGTLVCYERMAEDPAAMLARLADAVGFEVEPAQLEFEKHLNTGKVRGDLNVSKKPEPVSVESIRRRELDEATVNRICSRSQHRDWFELFSEFHGELHSRWNCRPGDLPSRCLERLAGR